MDTHTLPGAGRHPVVIGHLVVGLAFVGLVVLWAVHVSGVADGADLRRLLPVPWLVGGLAGLVALTVRSRRSSAHARSAPAEGP